MNTCISPRFRTQVEAKGASLGRSDLQNLIHGTHGDQGGLLHVVLGPQINESMHICDIREII